MNKLTDYSYEAIMSQVTNLLRTHTKATVNKYINTYRLYRKFLIETEVETEDNLSWVDKFKHYHETPKQRLVFSTRELTAFLAINDKYSMYFKLLARTGARPMEIASLQKRDVDFANNLLQIQQTKTGNGRTIPIPEDLADDFYCHIAVHESAWCFPIKNHPERHISLESLRKAFKIRQRTRLHAGSPGIRDRHSLPPVSRWRVPGSPPRPSQTCPEDCWHRSPGWSGAGSRPE